MTSISGRFRQSDRTTTAHKFDVLNSMIAIVRPRLRKFARKADTNHIICRYLPVVGSTAMAKVACRVILERIEFEQPVSKVACEIGDRLEIAARAAQTRDPKTYLRRVAQFAVAIGLNKARAIKLKEGRWEYRERMSIGLVLLQFVMDWTSMVKVVGDPDQRDRRRRHNLLIGTPECLAWLERTGEHYENERRNFAPKTTPHPDWAPGVPGLVRRREVVAGPKVYDAINRLQRVPWRVNRFLANVVDHCFTEGLAIADLPSSDKPKLEGWQSKTTWGRFQGDVFRWIAKRRRAARHIFQARALPDPIYYRWRMDFRGRVFPVHRFVYPHGGDMGKAMIEFADGQPIGDSAHYLAHYGANMWGMSRTSYESREKWVSDSEEFILKAVEDPVANDWWAMADHPWRFLAFCHEWHGVLNDGPDHITHMPCQIDATASGLQIIALLMRNTELAEMTNLVASDSPRDIYGEIAAEVTRRLRSHDHYGWLRIVGEIKRATVKPAVLRVAFGGNRYSATYATQKWFWEQPFDYPFFGKVQGPCRWLTNVIVDVLEERTRCSEILREWFRNIGRASWTSPSGLVVENHSYKKRDFKVRDVMRASEDTSETDARKTKRSLLPNFVQSLDAAALIEVVNRCDFDLVTSHDCFGALAPHLETLHRDVREVFSELFSRDLLAEFAEQMGIDTDTIPKRGVFDARSVTHATYAFT